MFRIASELGMSPSEVLFKHSATDLIRWAEVFKRRWNERTKLDYQLARITQLLWYLQFSFGGKPDSHKTMDDFFMSFDFKTGKDADLIESEEEREENARKAYLNASKGAWGALLGPAARAMLPKKVKTKAPPVPLAETPAGKVLQELAKGPTVTVTTRPGKPKPKKGAK